MIKFQQLNAFKAVYELGTMMAASAHIHVTQPAISRLVASLEHQLGFALFQRIRGRLVPTDKGRAFYQEVGKAFLALEHLEHSARDKGKSVGVQGSSTHEKYVEDNFEGVKDRPA